MSIKSILTRILPSYRMGKALQKQNAAMLEELLARMNQLDYKTEYLFWLSQNSQGEASEEAKRRVYRSMPKAKGSARMIQLTNLEILSQLRITCEEHEIPFYLAFGSMLGAIRNDGFIPWDDDVDIAMMRVDYERLSHVLEHHKTLRVETCYSTMNQKFVKIKFRDSDTFFVDVWIMDRFDADLSNIEQRFHEMRQVNSAFSKAIMQELQKRPDRSAYTLPRRDDALDEAVQAFLQNMLTSFPYFGGGEYVCFGVDMASFNRDAGGVYRYDEMFPPIEVQFEGMTFRTFRNYDQWLRNVYGDYWLLPHNLLGRHNDLSDLSSEDYSYMAELLKDDPDFAEAKTFLPSKMIQF